MKRQALGRGLSSLIPDKAGDPLAGMDIRNPRKSAADTAAPTPKKANVRASATTPSTASGAASAPDRSIDMVMGDEGQEPNVAETAVISTATAAPEGVARSSGGSLLWVDIDRIQPNPYQPRKQFPETEIEELVASIRASGILQPIILRRVDSGYGIVAGERRWRAAQRAGLLKVPAIVREIAEDKLLEVALIENIQRQNLNPIEEARAYFTLIEDFGVTPAEVAERVGKQRSSIVNSLRLLDLPARVQEMVEQGALSMGHARALAGLPNSKAQELGADIVAKKGFSVRETEVWVKRHVQDPEPAASTAARQDPHIRAAEESLQQALGTKVRILPSGGEKGRILIEYYSSEELNRLYDRLAKR